MGCGSSKDNSDQPSKMKKIATIHVTAPTAKPAAAPATKPSAAQAAPNSKNIVAKDKISTLPPQHLYKVFSYLSISHKFLLECFSKNIFNKLHKNPYYLNRRYGINDLKFTFYETK